MDNPIEMDTSPLGAALGESVRNLVWAIIPELLVGLSDGVEKVLQ